MMKPLNRRTLLQGLGATFALPFLDAMTPLSAVAARSPEAAPIRSVFVGMGGGMWTGENGFFPYREGTNAERALNWGKGGVLPGGCLADTGRNYSLVGTTLEPLTQMREHFQILSGLHHRNDEIPNTVVNAHGQDLGTLLTAANISSTPGVALKNAVSVDQLLAAELGRATRVASLALTAGNSSYNTREATGLGYMGFLSYDVDGYAVPTEGDPGAVFDRLFTEGTPQQQAERERLYRQNRSILDSVGEELRSLERSVAPQDRRKLDEYFSTVREVEQRIVRTRQWRETPLVLPPGVSRPGKVARNNDGSDRIEQMRLMIDVLVLALQTDVTRIATLRLGDYSGKFSFLGFPEDPHGVYAHNGGEPKKVEGARAIDRMHMEQFGYLLERMQSVQESDGTSLLHNSVVMLGAGLTNGPSHKVRSGKVDYNAHGQFNTPLLLAGHAGGQLRSGEHVNFDHGTPLANLLVSVMQAMGSQREAFADSTGPLGLV
ncbi:DUF1552 domain-containing protein [Lignipirellula cremea]|uniref:DUF1552 domain-containing protein n=1 Tax=Lignipirellula cremea TaxID=2528010 RepID=A0A518DYB9_9BACT|nr:DUF1552 domain-containing protein [Lignipirellula cremea]QDU96824.1 hypothetical protein Pla8534_46460 [Lignipirellula cremea]